MKILNIISQSYNVAIFSFLTHAFGSGGKKQLSILKAVQVFDAMVRLPQKSIGASEKTLRELSLLKFSKIKNHCILYFNDFENNQLYSQRNLKKQPWYHMIPWEILLDLIPKLQSNRNQFLQCRKFSIMPDLSDKHNTQEIP